MTDDATTSPNTTPVPREPEPLGDPTPEERLAETDVEDPEVGVDGTGMGELP
jgi:hypothetical protein